MGSITLIYIFFPGDSKFFCKCSNNDSGRLSAYVLQEMKEGRLHQHLSQSWRLCRSDISECKECITTLAKIKEAWGAREGNFSKAQNRNSRSEARPHWRAYSAFANSCPLQSDTLIFFPIIHHHYAQLSSISCSRVMKDWPDKYHI